MASDNYVRTLQDIQSGKLYAEDSAPTKVNVEGIAGKALDGITHAIKNTTSAINDLTSDINQNSRDAENRRRHDEIASLAAARNNRAAQAALLGKSDKLLSVTDNLKKVVTDALNTMLGIMKENLRISLRSYDETTRSLRGVFLNTEEIWKEELKADKATRIAADLGVTLSEKQTKDLVSELNKQGIQTKTFTETQIAAITAAQKAGIDAKSAVERVRLMNDADAKKMINTYAIASQQTGNRAFAAFHAWAAENATLVNNAIAQSGMSQADYMTAQSKFAQQIDSMLGEYVNGDEQAKLMESLIKLQSGQIETIEDKEILRLLGVAPEVFQKTGDKQALLLDGLQRVIKNGNQQQFRVLQNTLGGQSPLVNGISNAVAAGENYKTREIKGDDAAKGAYNENTPGGLLGKLSGRFISGINIVTGGVFSKLSAGLNKYFGESMSIETVVSRGFMTVITLLSAIVASTVLKSPIKSIVSAIAQTGIAQKLTGFFKGSSSDAPSSPGVPSIPAPGYKTPRDKLNEELKQVWGSIGDNIKKAVASAKERIDDMSMNVRIRMNEFKQSFKNFHGGSLKNTLASIKMNIAKNASDMRLNAKIAFAGMSTNIGNFARKGLIQLGKGIKAAPGAMLGGAKFLGLLGGVVTAITALVAATGAFDQLQPVFDAFIKQLAEPMNKLITSVKPVIEELTKLIGDVAAELINTLMPIVQGVLDVLTPIITSLINTLAPIITNVLKSLTPVLESLKIAIEPLKTLFNTLIPPLTDLLNALLEPLLNLLPTLIDLFVSLLPVITNILVPAITGITKVISFVVSPIINAIKVIAEGITDLVNKLPFKFGATGGIYDKPTNMIIGEAGKEVLLPLSNFARMQELMSSLSPAERAKVASAASSGAPTPSQPKSNNTSSGGAPGDDTASIQKILSYASDPQYVMDSLLYGRNKDGSLKSKKPDGFKKREAWYNEALSNAANQQGIDDIRGTYAERALAWGVSQLGLPYLMRSIGKIGYVCNELTNAALIGSGFDMKDFRIHSVKATFANIQNGKYVSGKDRKGRMREYPEFRLRPDITPQTAVPGMVFFQQAGKNKDGSFTPGHVGLVYYGHQKLHASGGSGDYTSNAGFLEKYQTPCRGVTVTPFDDGNYQFGEFPGLFEQATGEWKPPKNTPVKFGPDAGLDSNGKKLPGEDILKEQSDLTSSSNSALSKYASTSYGASIIKYITDRQMNSGETKEILSFMEIMTRYLRDMATSNRRPSGIASRPAPTKF